MPERSPQRFKKGDQFTGFAFGQPVTFVLETVKYVDFLEPDGTGPCWVWTTSRTVAYMAEQHLAVGFVQVIPSDAELEPLMDAISDTMGDLSADEIRALLPAVRTPAALPLSPSTPSSPSVPVSSAVTGEGAGR